MLLESNQQELRDLLIQSKSIEKQLESSYLESSRFLETIVESSSMMTADSQAIIRIVTMAEGSEKSFNVIFDALHQFLSQTSALASNLAEKEAEIFRTTKVIGEFVDWEDQLMRTLEPLRTMRTFFLIEIAKLQRQHQRAIRSVVDDIQGLYEQAHKVTEKELQVMRELKARIDRNQGAIQHELDALQRNIESEHVRLTRSLSGLSEDLQQNRMVDVELEKTTQRIADYVSEAVVAIQNEDITGQKFDHVWIAIQTILEKIDAWKQAGFSVEVQDLPKYIVSAARIQLKQIESILEDYASSNGTIERICPLMIESIQRLDSECLSLKEFNTLSTSADGAIQILLEAIEAGEALIRNVLKVLEQSEALLAPLSDVSSEMSDEIDNITMDLRVVTINANIMAARQGGRCGLNPLTENVGQISLASQKLSEGLREKLHHFVAEVKDSIAVVSALHDEAKELHTQYASFRSDGNAQLHAFRDEALALLHNLTQHAESIQEVTSHCSHTEPDQRYLGFCEQTAAVLEQLIQSTMDHCGSAVDFSKLHNEEIEALSQNYTMDSERKNQAHVTGVALADDASADEDDFILF